MDAALADKFNLIASYVALAIECGAVFVVAFGALQAMAALIKAIANGRRRGWKDAKSGSDSPPGSCSGSNLRLPPISCARRWRRPGTTSQSLPSSPRSAPCSTTSWRRTSWPSIRRQGREAHNDKHSHLDELLEVLESQKNEFSFSVVFQDAPSTLSVLNLSMG